MRYELSSRDDDWRSVSKHGSRMSLCLYAGQSRELEPARLVQGRLIVLTLSLENVWVKVMQVWDALYLRR
jgi:hypothetical protein